MMGKHISIDNKLGVLEVFMTTFRNKFTFFQSLIEDKKVLEEKCEALQAKEDQKITGFSDKDIVILREQLVKATSELELKNSTLKSYEEMNKKFGAKKGKWNAETEGI